MSPVLAHWLSAIVLGVLAVIAVVCFVVWFLDQTTPARIHLRTWRLADGRRLVQWVDGETEHFAVGTGDWWETAEVMGPPPLARGEPLIEPVAVQYLNKLWAREEQDRRAMDERRARRARKWAKQNKASLAQSSEEPRVVSASYGEHWRP